MIKPASIILNNLFESLDNMSASNKNILGLTTGFSELDNKISGILPSTLTVIAGRPSIGKTAFLLNLAEAFIFEENKPILFFSLESTAENLMLKLISSCARIDNKHLRNAKMDLNEWSKFTGANLMLQEKKFSICDDPSLSLDQISSLIIDFHKQYPNYCVLIDDIQRIKPYKNFEIKMTRSDELTEISRHLKELAQQLNIPIVINSQINRNVENRPNKRPVISDLRDCGAIEDNADLIIFIYREEVYYKETKDAGTAEIIIGKQRNGPIGTVRLAFEGQYTKFSNLSPEYYAQYDDEE